MAMNWWSGRARCPCGKAWIAAALDGVKLECPRCGEMTGEPEIA